MKQKTQTARTANGFIYKFNGIYSMQGISDNLF